MRSYGVFDAAPPGEGVSSGEKFAVGSLDLLLSLVDAIIKVADAIRKRVDRVIDS